MINKVFAGRYRITEKIGIGGMAEVYKATDETLGRTVAVKVMLPQYAADETFAVRFRQEAQAAANVQSPYIVNIYDWGFDESSKTYFIVMEYIRGTDLKTAIQQRGAINQRKVAEIGSQVAAALGVAHSYDIIHRDVKPQNIMIQPDGNAKVMDFGIARANSANLTQTGSVLGTAYYVSPEQAQGKDLTQATDIYSLGVVLYEAVTGRVPFDGPDAVSIAVMQVNEIPTPPRALDNSIDAGLEAIILKALSKNPADRFRTADEMRLALNEYLQGKPVQSAAAEARTQVIRTPAVVPPAAATAVMPELATAATHTRAGTNGNGARAKSSTSNSKTPVIVALVIGLVVILAGVGAYLAFCSSDAGDIAVPKVVGLTETDAKKMIEDAQLTVGEVKQQSSETVEEGRIISQDPAAQTKVREGTKINLVISSGTGNVVVPDLTNKTEAEAKKILADLDLVYESGGTAPHPDIDKGRICSQSPAPTTKVAQKSKVICVISAGKETAQVPNFYGQWYGDVENQLLAAGFKVAYADDVYSNSVDAGRVVSQDTTGEAAKGSTVTLTLSKGPEPTPTPKVIVPNLIGMDVSAASNALAAKGLALDYSDDPTGKVVATQTPAANTEVEVGTTVKVTFA
ncbi:MAG: Stk1 family PASTA domain-containing Ser/Thr kinase [Coriobacteriales bacterium]|nr:Stk1 family PASTA domain-containing Ser/Thr kinase [Coriobacteriales bacterium]